MNDRSTGALAPETLLVLYEDNHLIAVHKPANLLTQGDATGDVSLMDVVKAWLKARYGKPGNVFLGLLHRLDRPVAGVVLFAKTSKGASRLSEQIRTRAVEKTYRALVDGTIPEDERSLRHFLGDGATHGGRVAVHDEPGPDRKEARLSYRVLSRAHGRTLVEIALETGRKHQIRAQFAAIGHPLTGDARYGGVGRTSDEGIALCAVRLTFDHPITQERIVVTLPDAVMSAALRTPTG